MIKTAVSNIAWAAEQDNEIYPLLSAIGIDAIEAAPNRLVADNPYGNIAQAQGAVQQLKTAYGLPVVSLQAICFGRNEAIFGDEEERNTIKHYIKKAIDFAAAIQCGNIVFGSPKNRIIGEGQYRLAVDFFSELGVYASGKNVVFAIEPNPVIYGTNFLNTTTEALNFVRDCAVPGLKVNFDCGTAIYNNEDINILTEAIGFINHIHISEPYLEPLQQRAIHKDLAEILSTSGYDGYISVEMKSGPDVEEIKNILHYFTNVFGNNYRN